MVGRLAGSVGRDVTPDLRGGEFKLHIGRGDHVKKIIVEFQALGSQHP